MSRLEWAAENMRLLRSIAAEFEETRPFDGLVIGTGIHLEPNTAALLLTLRAGGADLIATGNLNSTQPETVAYLKRHGIRVIATPTRDAGAHAAELRAILHAEPHLLLDNGGDLFAAWLENPYARLLGGTEETTSGRMRLTPLRDQIGKPIRLPGRAAAGLAIVDAGDGRLAADAFQIIQHGQGTSLGTATVGSRRVGPCHHANVQFFQPVVFDSRHPLCREERGQGEQNRQHEGISHEVRKGVFHGLETCGIQTVIAPFSRLAQA